MENEMMESAVAEALPEATSEVEAVDEASGHDAPTASPADGGEEDGALMEYRRRAREDMDEIRRLRPEYGEAEHLSDLSIAVPFALFRGMGYGVEEALAFAESGAARLGGKSHQRPVATRRQNTAGTGMSYRELADCRELFGNGLSDGELRELYQRVTR